MDKTCTKCNSRKSEEEFPWRQKGVQRHSNCKECVKEHRKSYYHNNKESFKQQTRSYYQNNKQRVIDREVAYRKKRIAEARKFVREYISNSKCVDCGTHDHRVLEFDHVRGVKTDNISFMVTKGKSIDALKSEIAKCEVRCANCHRIRHYEERRLKNAKGSLCKKSTERLPVS